VLKFVLPLLLFAGNAFAQMYDLRTLPLDYSFVSIEPDARVTVNYIGREGGAYLFEEISAYYDGHTETVNLKVNNASQTTYWSNGVSTSVFSPHDCAPSLGECFYKFTDENGPGKARVTSQMIGDVLFSEEFYRSEGEWLFWNRSCTIYDDYGFWVDFVRIDWDGKTAQGYREKDTPDRIDELWRICDPAAAVS
jgi:hypothetical protein